MKKLVSLLRVSTKTQGSEGLGISAQRAAIEAYRASQNANIIAEYVEVESGGKANRAILNKALNHAKSSNATLTISKLDRLTRSLGMLVSIMDSGVDFCVTENPNYNRLTLSILGAVAEQEKTAIGNRVREALKQARLRGTKLGSARENHWNESNNHRRIEGQRLACKAAAIANHNKAQQRYSYLIDELNAKRQTMTLIELAGWLNSQGHTTSRNKPFTPTAVMRILKRNKSA